MVADTLSHHGTEKSAACQALSTPRLVVSNDIHTVLGDSRAKATAYVEGWQEIRGVVA